MRKVSIIVPTYNNERCISNCLTSIIGQTYCKIEVIVIDDGSEDRTGEIVRGISDNIKYIYQSNQGPSAARNTGIKEATGYYLTFVDADDIIEKTMIADLISRIESTDADLAICGMDFVTIENTHVNVLEHYPGKSQTIRGNKNIFESLYPYFNTNKVNAPVGKLYKKKIIDKYHILFDENLSLGEDFIFNLNYFSHINSFSFLGKALYKYRRGSNYLTTRYSGPFELGKKLMYMKARAILRKYNVSQSFLNSQLIIICFSYFMEIPRRFPSSIYKNKRNDIMNVLKSVDIQKAVNNNDGDTMVKILALILKMKNPDIIYFCSIIIIHIKRLVRTKHAYA